MAQIPKGRLVEGPYKPICRDCAIYFYPGVLKWRNPEPYLRLFCGVVVQVRITPFSVLEMFGNLISLAM